METVPEQEIESRIGKFQLSLQEMGLDGAFILQNTDLYYFSGTIQSSVLFIPREGEPVLMVQKGLQRARLESSLKHILPAAGKGQVKRVLRDFDFLSLKKIGLEMDVLPTNLYFQYQKLFPGCDWSDVSGVIQRLRMIKTPYEVEQIREAARILHKGFSEIKEMIREGVTELEIDGRLALIARREGHMGILRMRGWNQEMTYAHVLSGESGATVSFLDSPHGGKGNTPAMAQGASFRKIGKNEPIGIDYGVGINGYLADQFRTFVIGELPSELVKAHDFSLEIHRLFAEEAKPDISCSHLYHLTLKEAEKNGFGEHFMGYGEGKVRFVGHGIGLEIDEYPILAPRFNQKLSPGMVIALEPKFVFPGKGVVGLEDDYLVTATGVERLTLTDQTVLKL
ncbi:MAG: M24 family metallopeptidase [Thermodesulfobacteriota bacterium]